MILSSTNPTWIYLISISCIVPVMHRKRFSIVKFLLVITSLCGFITIAMQDKSSDDGSIVGDLFTVLSAIFFAFYSIFLKVAIPEEQEPTFKFSWFLGFVGLINDIAILPLFFIFNWTGLEVFEWPNRQTFLLLTANALVGTVISDYCWARSVVLVGPLQTSLGITLTFPISLILDYFVNDKSFNWAYYLGSSLIFGAFGGIVYLDYREAQLKKKQDETNDYLAFEETPGEINKSDLT